MVSLFVGQLCIFLHVSLLFLVGLRVVNIPFGRLIECCTYDVNPSSKKAFHNCIVPTITPSAHALGNAFAFTILCKRVCTVLHTLIGVEHQCVGVRLVS